MGSQTQGAVLQDLGVADRHAHLPGRFLERHGLQEPQLQDLAVALGQRPQNAPSAFGGRAAVRVGLRPEEIKVSFALREGEPSLAIRLLEPLGSQVLVIAERDGADVTISVPADAVPEKPERLGVVPAGCVVHLFDRDDGVAVAHFRSA